MLYDLNNQPLTFHLDQHDSMTERQNCCRGGRERREGGREGLREGGRKKGRGEGEGREGEGEGER